MPRMVKLTPNPAFVPADAAQKAVFEKIKKDPIKTVPYITAVQNVRLSGGMFKIDAGTMPQPEGMVDEGPDLEKMTVGQLKVMLASLGIKTEKKMKRVDMIGLIQRKLDEIEVEDDEGADE